MLAVRNRMSLRKTGLIRVPQRPPPNYELCQYTDYGFAADIRSRTAGQRDARPYEPDQKRQADLEARTSGFCDDGNAADDRGAENCWRRGWKAPDVADRAHRAH